MNRPIVRFASIFFLFLLGFSVLSVTTTLQNRLRGLEDAIAGASTWMATVAGGAASVVDGHYISVGSMTLNINHECTGVFVLFVLASFIAAYPATLAAKAIGIVVGVVGLQFVNVVRIATLVRLVEFYPSLFKYFHEYVWQGAFLMLVTLYAITWVEWARR
jgi:exosortase/archaeosortase family protein